MILESLAISRFAVAFFASGVFWLMVLFYAEKGWRRSGLPGVGVAAAIVLTAAGIIFFKVVVDDAPWRTPRSAWATPSGDDARPPDLVNDGQGLGAR